MTTPSSHHPQTQRLLGILSSLAKQEPSPQTPTELPSLISLQAEEASLLHLTQHHTVAHEAAIHALSSFTSLQEHCASLRTQLDEKVAMVEKAMREARAAEDVLLVNMKVLDEKKVLKEVCNTKEGFLLSLVKQQEEKVHKLKKQCENADGKAHNFKSNEVGVKNIVSKERVINDQSAQNRDDEDVIDYEDPNEEEIVVDRRVVIHPIIFNETSKSSNGGEQKIKVAQPSPETMDKSEDAKNSTYRRTSTNGNSVTEENTIERRLGDRSFKNSGSHWSPLNDTKRKQSPTPDPPKRPKIHDVNDIEFVAQPARQAAYTEYCVAFNLRKECPRNCTRLHRCIKCKSKQHPFMSCIYADYSRVPANAHCILWNSNEGMSCRSTLCTRLHACMFCGSDRHASVRCPE